MKIKKPVSAPETQRKIKRSYLTIATVAAAVIVMALPVYADDPLATINALSDFVFSAIKAIVPFCWASALCRSVSPSKATMPGSARRAL